MAGLSAHDSGVDQAVILAAGNGDRFRNGSPHSKLLTPVAGVPLLTRTLNAAFRAGVSLAHVVLGFDADSVRALAERSAPSGLELQFHVNADWHRENGLSVLAARDGVDGRPFAIMMGDHLVHAAALEQLLHTAIEPRQALLCVDRRPCDAASAAEATKVRIDHDRVRAIGKALQPFDALDTGLFVCQASLFDALEAACAAGDTTLTAGVRQLATRNLVRPIEMGDRAWCDVDTVEDLAVAERLSALSQS